jgi:hypothetical protein
VAERQLTQLGTAEAQSGTQSPAEGEREVRRLQEEQVVDVAQTEQSVM